MFAGARLRTAQQVLLQVGLCHSRHLQKEFKGKDTPPPSVVRFAFPQIPQRWFVSRAAGRKSRSRSISSEAPRPWRDPRVRVSECESVCVHGRERMVSVPSEGVPLKMCVNVRRPQHIDSVIIT